MTKGMIKVSVLYPNGDGHTFDLKHYTETHMPMVGALIGDAMKGGAMESGLGGPGNTPPAYLIMSHMYFETVEAFEASFGPNAEKIMGDIPNFTNAQPVVQISEVLG